MKALSVRQPWAHAVFELGKDMSSHLSPSVPAPPGPGGSALNGSAEGMSARLDGFTYHRVDFAAKRRRRPPPIYRSARGITYVPAVSRPSLQGHRLR